MTVLAFDTSNYTTSVAVFDGEKGHNVSRLLDVEQGSLGLRQSDALFAHVKRLPELTDRLFSDIGRVQLDAIGVSTRQALVTSYPPMGHSSQAMSITSMIFGLLGTVRCLKIFSKYQKLLFPATRRQCAAVSTKKEQYSASESR